MLAYDVFFAYCDFDTVAFLIISTVQTDRYKAGVVLFFGRQDEVVVLVAERLEGGPVSSRVSTFPDVFSMAEGGSKCTEGGRKPWV